ncbi:uncharacterized protein LOC125654350 [Ostrea edulis]|uniref:uncharacterized protein LOC125654350 n=1 Tax=Ostrea edulis TaxID=37623 RepID=UPI0024AF1F6C|nr:uncharacterized protein LOC125654350 [Ostrea edulis]
MDLRRSAQDVVRCDLCETAIVQMYCDFCHINLCIACIGKHIADDYEKHKVVPFQNRKSTLIYPKCCTHQTEKCQFHCKECDKSVCSLCNDNMLSSDKHKGHTFSILSEIYNKRKVDITKDSEEIENIISPTYEEMATDLETQITNLDGEYVKFTTVVTKHGEEWHKEIANVINKMKNEIEEMKTKHLEILKKHLDEIKQIQSLIEQSLITLKEMEESNEVSVTMEYRSKNKEFRKLPPKVRVSLPTFSPNTIDNKQLYKSLGSLIPLSFTIDENGSTLKKAETSPKELMDEPELVTTINTGYENVRNVTCLSEKEFWTGAEVNDMKCFNIQGTVINTIKTKSGEWPRDIAVTSDGDLVYSDMTTKSLNKVKSGRTEEVIRLQGWISKQFCFTPSGDLLVAMYSDDLTESKVVRYSGSTEKQTIQYDDEDKPLYSGNIKIKYICENRNLDICVADWKAGAVVVVNQAGKFRFRYTGHSSSTKNNAFLPWAFNCWTFKPWGITTDSQSQILTADCDNHCIHILDQDGQLLRYIDKCDLKHPFGLCVDKSDNLFVAEYNSGNVKKIKFEGDPGVQRSLPCVCLCSNVVENNRIAMDPCNSGQDVVRCDLCETAIVQMYCDFCHVKLCIACIGKHIVDDYDKHKVVPFQNRKSTLIYPKCSTHQTRKCQFHCKECDKFVCSFCTAYADKHKGHTFSILSEIYNERKVDITKDSEEIENIISPTYEEMVTDLETQITNLDGEYVKFTTVITKHREDWHKEIDNAINKMRNEMEEMKIKHLGILKKHLDEIKQIQSLIEQSLITLKEMEESNEMSVTMEYRSQNKEFRKLPPKVRVSLPTFSPNTIDSEQLYKSLGSLIPLSFTTDENGYTLKKTETSPKELMEEPELVTTINTGYENLHSVTCLSEEEFWTSAEVSDMKWFNVQSTVINTIKTKSGKWPNDIAVTSDGDLVYSDWKTNTVNKVKSDQKDEVIILQGWKPGNLCVTSCGDLLVTMFSDDKTQSKVVRYSGFTEKQTIQYDDEGKPLYSGNIKIKYISENRNLDICVADLEAGAVVVANQTGKLRFRYTGHLKKNKVFKPWGITTDSESHILTADCNNHCIHILDQNGHFLHYIDNCDLKDPYGLCVDKSGNLFVAEFFTGNVKKIKYLQ